MIFNRIEVSIVIPTFNRQKSLLGTLDSLFNQTFPQENFEIIIVDDGSTVDISCIINEIKKIHQNIRYFKQKNRGAASARNLGISNSNGDIIGFTDDDCIVSSNWIELAVESMHDLKLCGVQGITLPQKKILKIKKIFYFADVATITGKEKHHSYGAGNIFYRKKNLIEVSGFDEKLLFAEDDDLAFNLIKKGYIIHFNRNMVVYHEVRYINFINYVFKRLKRNESIPLFYKKHPELRDRFFFNFFDPTHLYLIFGIGTIFIYFLNLNVSIPSFFTIFAFLVKRVFIDGNYIMMFIRILLFWRYFIIDSANFYYLVKGSIKHETLLI